MKNIDELEHDIHDMEVRLEKKIKELYKYKKSQHFVKVITFSSVAVLMFTRSGRHHDIYLWFIGLYMIMLALGELFDYEELRFFQKENKDT